jgi:site-specific recombinase XerC
MDQRIITLTRGSKRGLPRSFNVLAALIGMLNGLPKQNDKVFGTMSENSAIARLILQRRWVANELNNPRISKIHFHLILHWYATMEYHKKPDIFYFAKLLGHKHVATTEIYINMEKTAFGEGRSNYIVKAATAVDEAFKLMEVGFEYVTDVDGQKLSRKRK